MLQPERTRRVTAAAVGSLMAGRTEEGVGEPETVALQTAILASDLLDAVGRDGAP